MFLKSVAYIIFILFLWFLVSLVIYRIPIPNKNIIIQGRPYYQIIDFKLSNRDIFEELLGNNVVRIKGYEPFYLSQDKIDKIWKDTLSEMINKKYDFKIVVKVKPLLFGGVGYAKILEIHRLEEEPIVNK